MYEKVNRYNYLEHHGIKGQKWGIRRYQNEDGTLTAEGKKRYYNSDGSLTAYGRKELKRETRELEKYKRDARATAGDHFINSVKKSMISSAIGSVGVMAENSGIRGASYVSAAIGSAVGLSAFGDLYKAFSSSYGDKAAYKAERHVEKMMNTYGKQKVSEIEKTIDRDMDRNRFNYKSR